MERATVGLTTSDGRYSVRISPGGSYGDGGNARAEFYEWRYLVTRRMTADVRLVNRIAPVDALVSNAGYLITFDNWHEAGHLQVAAIYDPRGRLRSAYGIEQLYPADRVALLPRSVSSRQWRCRPWGWIDPNAQTAVFVNEHLGGTFVFRLPTGAFEYRVGQSTCQ